MSGLSLCGPACPGLLYSGLTDTYWWPIGQEASLVEERSYRLTRGLLGGGRLFPQAMDPVVAELLLDYPGATKILEIGCGREGVSSIRVANPVLTVG